MTEDIQTNYVEDAYIEYVVVTGVAGIGHAIVDLILWHHVLGVCARRTPIGCR